MANGLCFYISIIIILEHFCVTQMLVCSCDTTGRLTLKLHHILLCALRFTESFSRGRAPNKSPSSVLVKSRFLNMEFNCCWPVTRTNLNSPWLDSQISQQNKTPSSLLALKTCCSAQWPGPAQPWLFSSRSALCRYYSSDRGSQERESDAAMNWSGSDEYCNLTSIQGYLLFIIIYFYLILSL